MAVTMLTPRRSAPTMADDRGNGVHGNVGMVTIPAGMISEIFMLVIKTGDEILVAGAQEDRLLIAQIKKIPNVVTTEFRAAGDEAVVNGDGVTRTPAVEATP